ncbi:hypothetical protein GCM10009563_10910 [Subtercola frigoramans]
MVLLSFNFEFFEFRECGKYFIDNRPGNPGAVEQDATGADDSVAEALRPGVLEDEHGGSGVRHETGEQFVHVIVGDETVNAFEASTLGVRWLLNKPNHKAFRQRRTSWKCDSN